MRVKKNKAFAYRIYSHFTQQCPTKRKKRLHNVSVIVIALLRPKIGIGTYVKERHTLLHPICKKVWFLGKRLQNDSPNTT